MSPYSGLVDLSEKKGILAKDGNSLKYTAVDGTVIKQFRKAWERNDNNCLDKIMKDLQDNPDMLSKQDTVKSEEEAE
jgi:hypothetical protein